MQISRAGRTTPAAVSALVGTLFLAGCTTSGSVTPAATSVASGKTTAPSQTAAPNSSSSPYTGDPALKTFYTEQISWTACKKSASAGSQAIDLSVFQCGTLHVPLDYTHPAGDALDLAVIREPAADPAKRIGSLLVNPGGPGASGVDMVEQAKKDFDGPLHQNFDIVGFDPRGIGQSDPINCLTGRQRDVLSEQDEPADPVARKAKDANDNKNYVAACEAHSGKLLPFIGTRNVARDMDVLRQVLGDKKLDYLGISYGTYLGSLYAEQFPQNTGHLVLDGAVDPNANQLEAGAQQQIGFENSLEKFAADCVTNHAADCPLGTDPKTAAAKAGAFLDGLRDHPIPTQDQSGRKLDSGLGWTGAILFLYGGDTTSWQYLRMALTQAMNGDGSFLLQAADQYNGRDATGHYDTQQDGLVAVRCADFAGTTPSPAQVQQVYTEIKQKASILNTTLSPDDLAKPSCQDWPFQTTEKPHPIKADGAAPILVVGTTDDPATPYASAVSLAQGFAHATLLTRVGEGHAAFGSGNVCVDQAMDAYLISGTMPPAGTRCTK